MRTLMLGAGAVGGYFGGRLLEAGRDVTFLVRPRRAAQLQQNGLRIASHYGALEIPKPATVAAADLREPFDLVIFSCKAYDLESAIDDCVAAVGVHTVVLPLLNGMRHLDRLDDRIGPDHVLGGQCAIGSTVDESGQIVHLNEIHSISFGERDGSRSPRIDSISRLMEGARFEARASTSVLLDMWEKWVFLASLAAGTCLMRSAVGDIVGSPGGPDLMAGLLAESRTIAEAQGYAPRQESWSRAVGMLTASGSSITASMLRDIERGSAIEGDHIVGDLLRRAGGIPTPHLRLAYTHLKAYEARRARG
jgi:2-dehydropantoate 2-reductase